MAYIRLHIPDEEQAEMKQKYWTQYGKVILDRFRENEKNISLVQKLEDIHQSIKEISNGTVSQPTSQPQETPTETLAEKSQRLLKEADHKEASKEIIQSYSHFLKWVKRAKQSENPLQLFAVLNEDNSVKINIERITSLKQDFDQLTRKLATHDISPSTSFLFNSFIQKLFGEETNSL